MNPVEIAPELLADLRQTATNCQPQIWKLDEHSDVVSDAHKVADCYFLDDAEHIATADPATVLALVAEIAVLNRAIEMAVNSDFMGGGPMQNDPQFWISHARKQLKESEAGR